MLKFLRRYNKILLAVFGTLLLVVWLVPEAIEGLSRRAAEGAAVWATVGEDQEEVSARMRVQCAADLDAFERIGLPVPGLGAEATPEHWFLLVREAEEAGVMSGGISSEMNAQQAAMLAPILGSTREFDGPLTRWFGVMRLVELYSRADKLSDRRLLARAREYFHGVDASFVIIPAKADDAPGEPTEPEITAHFEKYRDVAPGQGEHGMGYRLPDRVKLEWLEVAGPAIRAAIEKSDRVDGIALARHWQKNQSKLEFPPFEFGAEIPQVVRDDFVNEQMSVLRDEVSRWIASRVSESQRGLKTVGGGYLELPADWSSRQLDLVVLADEMTREFPGIERAAYQAIGDRWLTIDDVRGVERMSGATTEAFGGRASAISLVDGIREFGKTTGVTFQARVISPALQTAEGGLIVLRVTDADGARAPRDAAECGPALVQDLKRLKAWELLKAEQASIEGIARSTGLLGLALSREAEVQRQTAVQRVNADLAVMMIRNNMAPALTPSTIPLLGQDESVVDAIIDHALRLPGNLADPSVTSAQRIIAVPSERHLALVVAELKAQVPLDRERFIDIARIPALRNLILAEEAPESGEEDAPADLTFGFDTMAARNQFRLVVREAEGEPESADANASD